MDHAMIESLEARTLFAVAVDPALVAWYTLDQGAGTVAVDASGHGNAGTLVNSPKWVAGKNGTALQFNSAGSNRVVVNDSPSLDLTTNITLSAWVKTSKKGSQVIIEKARYGATDGYELGLSSNGKAFFRINQKTCGDAFRIDSVSSYSTKSVWTHVAGTFDGTTLRIYINGALQGSKSAATAIAVNNIALGIGSQDNAYHTINGVIDDARVYSRALSASEVAAIFQNQPPVSDLTTKLNIALGFAQSQLKQTMTDLGNSTSRFVNRTSNSTGLWNVVGANDWTSGFLGGQMWQLADATSDSYWSGKATAWTSPLAGQATAQTEDLYFRLMTTFLPLYQRTGDAAYRQVLLGAAASKNTQWNETVGAFETTWRKSSSGNPAANYGVLMDQTTDMLLMLWAAKQLNNQTYYDRAVRHTRSVVNDLLRSDGSSYQFGYFDKTTGVFVDGETSQGYANESTWARGQAWAIFALTAIARETGLGDILAGAQKAADWYVSHLPSDSVPYWDFNAPITSSTYRDSSAAAIAASGLLDLSTLVTASADQSKYRMAAMATLTSLASTAYLAQGSISHGILLHGAQNVPNVPAGNDVSLSFGDYFFLQAINRYKALGL